MNNYSVYLITMDKASQFFYSMDKGAKDMAKLTGVDYKWDAPMNRNVEEQIQIINRVVKSGADAILLAAIDPLAIGPVVEDAKAKGVKIIYVDAPSYVEAITTLGTENYSAGRIAGETMLSKLEAVGIRNGSIGIVGVTPETVTTMNRERGFRNVIEEDGKFKLLTTSYTKGEQTASINAALSFMKNNPDLVGLFGTNEDTTIGIGTAISTSGKKITGVGFDVTAKILEMIKQDILQAVLVQNPYTMGYLGMTEAIAALKGYNTGPSFINTGVSVIDKYTPVRLLPKL